MHLTSLTLHADRFPDRAIYPFSLPVFQNSGRIEFRSNIAFFAGENGSGKSTLLRALSKRCGIHIWAEECWSRSHYNRYEEALFNFMTVTWSNGPRPGCFFSAETYDHMTRMIELWASDDPGLLDYFGGTSLMELSHGESIMAFFKSRYAIEGLYLLDEPETALSPKRQIEFAALLQKMGNDGHAQFIIATHSPIILSVHGASIFSFDSRKISETSFQETEHFRVYKDFFEKKRYSP
ncbi:MAG: AAA family ATPase [Chitinispirillaceae bacterium]|nr:AAA family ATPase [Chitinispirillaceae bacterium]